MATVEGAAAGSPTLGHWLLLRDEYGILPICSPGGISLRIPEELLGQGKQLQVSDGTATLTFAVDPP